MNKINIIGTGPGNPDFILPIARKIIDSSETVIGSKRNLESFDLDKKKVIELDADFLKIADYIKKNSNKEKISVVVSGDPLFYSLLGYLKKLLPTGEMNIIPGISSMQYFFAKIGLSYENVKFISLHGRNSDIEEMVKNNDVVFILTDKNNSPQKIAQNLINKNIVDKIAYIGSNLSYNNEIIVKDSLGNIVNNKNNFDLSVMVITDE
jgi:cobalt-precorrin-7 (C5)-methyltransferase